MTIPGPPPANLLTKMLIEHAPGTGTVQLTGTSCSTGKPLRFCYPASSPGEDCTASLSTPKVVIDLFFRRPGLHALSCARPILALTGAGRARARHRRGLSEVYELPAPLADFVKPGLAPQHEGPRSGAYPV